MKTDFCYDKARITAVAWLHSLVLVEHRAHSTSDCFLHGLQKYLV